MATATATTVLAGFQVECLGVDSPDYFPGYGLARIPVSDTARTASGTLRRKRWPIVWK